MEDLIERLLDIQRIQREAIDAAVEGVTTNTRTLDRILGMLDLIHDRLAALEKGPRDAD